MLTNIQLMHSVRKWQLEFTRAVPVLCRYLTSTSQYLRLDKNNLIIIDLTA
jgi:putative component of membrane protein insertase Oxa1/YidC/SpoIIIJ protein YidD